MSDASTSTPPPVEPLFDAATLGTRVAELGRTIERDLGAEDPLLLGLLGGSVIFLADLVRAIDGPVRFEFVKVGASDAQGGGEILDLQYPIAVELAGQSVLVIKDVVASGIVESYLEQQIRSRGAASVRFAALIDLPDERKTDLDVDYRAFTTTRRAGTLVGYGLKHQGRWGNLPYVGRLREGA